MSDTVTKLLAGKLIAVVTHYYGTGPGEALREFLPTRVANFFWLGYPLYQGKPIQQVTGNNKQVTVNQKQWVRMPEVVRYCREVLYTIRAVIKTGQRFDLYIGIDNLNAFAGIILRALGKVDKVAYYTIDFVPQRFKNPLMNALYHRVDRFCVEHADITWNLSSRMVEGREKISGFPKRLRVKQMELPIGVWWHRIKLLPFAKVKQHQAIFVGHLTEKQGLQLVIEAIPAIVNQVPHFHLDIIGDGPYRSTLEQLAEDTSVSNYVTFHGFIKDDREVEQRIARAAITLALYRKANDPFTYYADPGKLKIYLAASVPVLLTDLPAIAREIEHQKAGVICSYDPSSVAAAIVKLMSNPIVLRRYRTNARTFAKQFDWPTIFEKAFSSVL